MGKYYITTAIPYASKLPHVGNTYEAIFTDAIARYHRLIGDDVFFLTGTDEHGQKIQQQAEAEGITPQALANRVTEGLRAIWDRCNVSYDKFIRTTDDDHKAAVSAIFMKLYRQGDIYKSSYEGWYCTPDESFYTDSQALKDGAEGDGRVCPDCGRPLERAKEEAYFFRLSKYAPMLLEHLEKNPDFLVPESRKNEMVNNFLKPGLQDLCVTRSSFSWGVPVEIDLGHVIYVWIDALSNYITALGYHPDGSGELFLKNWPAELHVVGKDIVRFHFLYWPCILLALGLPLYKQLYGHGWFNMGTEKMSKSSGNTLYAQDLADIYGVDGLRYYLLREMPFSADSSITVSLMTARYNTDLANDLGNLLSRTVAMVEKYIGTDLETEGSHPDVEAVRLEAVAAYTRGMDTLHVQQALTDAWKLIDRCNKHIDETMPWALAKDPAKADELRAVLSTLCRALHTLCVLLTPILPETADKMATQLGLEEKYRAWESLNAGHISFHVRKAGALFPRIE